MYKCFFVNRYFFEIVEMYYVVKIVFLNCCTLLCCLFIYIYINENGT